MKADLTGRYIIPDSWKYDIGEVLKVSDGFKDSCFPGCEYRLPGLNLDIESAVNVKITGRKIIYRNNCYKSGWMRAKIEYVQDDNEPSIFDGAWLLMEKNY